jgi:TatD DNase family protein
MTVKYFDIHSHVNDKRFANDLPDVLSRMREADVASIVVGTDREMSERAIALAEEHDDLWAIIGQHPTDTHEEIFDKAWYRTQVEHPRVVGVGECGLDYYWPTEKPHGELDAEKERQRVLFEEQIAIAREAKKPLMVHGRPSRGSMDAYEDILAVLKQYPGVEGNIHFFVGNTDIAKQFLDLGFTMSFTGVLTFTNDYDAVVKYIPLDRMMSETDAPYVAPTPHRGKKNEPAFVIEVVKAIARIRGEDEMVVQQALLASSRRVFML